METNAIEIQQKNQTHLDILYEQYSNILSDINVSRQINELIENYQRTSDDKYKYCNLHMKSERITTEINDIHTHIDNQYINKMLKKHTPKFYLTPSIYWEIDSTSEKTLISEQTMKQLKLIKNNKKDHIIDQWLIEQMHNASQTNKHFDNIQQLLNYLEKEYKLTATEQIQYLKNDYFPVTEYNPQNSSNSLIYPYTPTEITQMTSHYLQLAINNMLNHVEDANERYYDKMACRIITHNENARSKTITILTPILNQIDNLYGLYAPYHIILSFLQNILKELRTQIENLNELNIQNITNITDPLQQRTIINQKETLLTILISGSDMIEEYNVQIVSVLIWFAKGDLSYIIKDICTYINKTKFTIKQLLTFMKNICSLIHSICQFSYQIQTSKKYNQYIYDQINEHILSYRACEYYDRITMKYNTESDTIEFQQK